MIDICYVHVEIKLTKQKKDDSGSTVCILKVQVYVELSNSDDLITPCDLNHYLLSL